MRAEPILFDLSEFITQPLRTGIQRVAYQVVASWPRPNEFAPARVGEDGTLHVLPGRLFDAMHDFFNAPPEAAGPLCRRIQEQARRGTPLPDRGLADRRALLCAELFCHPTRMGLYHRLIDSGLGSKLHFVVYDFLPWLRPEWLPRATSRALMSYLTLLRRVNNLSFISEQTRDDFLNRIVRDPARPVGPVIPLGSDGLGTAEPRFDPAGRRFSVISTLEPRKNHMEVVAAFKRLWAEGADVELAFAGRCGWLRPEDLRVLDELRKSEPRFDWRESASDREVVGLIRGSRATIYPSQGEGYGLPPMESLALGVPVVVTRDIPSVAMIEPLGQSRLAVPDAEHIYRAVRELLDDSVARRKHEEIGRLRLPRWSDMGESLARWLGGDASADLRRAA